LFHNEVQYANKLESEKNAITKKVPRATAIFTSFLY